MYTHGICHTHTLLFIINTLRIGREMFMSVKLTDSTTGASSKKELLTGFFFLVSFTYTL